jgi:hypothetical protein
MESEMQDHFPQEESDTLLRYILKSAGLLQDYLQLFKQNEIVSEDILAEITAENLTEIGITNKKHAEKILHAREMVLGAQ